MSQVQFPGSAASCSGNALTSTVTHAVNLGIWCQFNSDPFQFFYSDWAAECVDPDHDFDNTVGEYGFDIARYTCRESTTFSVGSTTAQTIRNVSISTDDTFREDPDGCFTINSAPSTPTVVVTFPPSVPPMTSDPSTAPTIVPSRIPSNIPSRIPTAIPTKVVTVVPPTKEPVSLDAPFGAKSGGLVTAAPVIVQTSSTSDNSIIGIVIGCVGGGFALAAFIAMMLFIKQRDTARGSTGATKSKRVDSTPSHTEFNSGHDFSASQSRSATSGTITESLNLAPIQSSTPMIPPLVHPETERSSHHHRSSHNRVNDPHKPDISLYMVSPDTPYRNHSTHRRPATASRSSYPTHHVVDVKDQCRSVAMIRSSSPTFTSQASNSQIPIAVAMGVQSVTRTTTTTAAAAEVATSSTSSYTQPEATRSNSTNYKPEPDGRHMMDDR